MSKKKAKKASGNKAVKVKPAKVVKKAKSVVPKKASAKTTTKVSSSKKAKSVKTVAKKIKAIVKKDKPMAKGKMSVQKYAAKKVKETIKPAIALKKAAKKSPVGKTKPVKEDKIIKSKMAEGIEANKIKSEKTAAKAKKGKKKKKGDDDDDEPIIEVDDILLAEIISAAKPPKKKHKEVKQLRTFVNPMASLTVAKIAEADNKKKGTVKELKGKFELEYVIGTSPAILYEFLTTPSGLSEWFADDVNIHDGVFTFLWEGSEQKALLLDFKEEKYIRFRWLDKPEGSYFEFRIQIDELTGDVSLMVTDFADEGSDLQTSKLLWDSQIHSLMNVIGSY